VEPSFFSILIKYFTTLQSFYLAFVEENGPDVQRSSSMRSTEGEDASGGQVIGPLKGQYQKKLECEFRKSLDKTSSFSRVVCTH
jgi:hypothetical protein